MLAGPAMGSGAPDTGLLEGPCLGARLTGDRASRGSPAQLGVASLPHESHNHQRGGHGRVLACQIATVALGGITLLALFLDGGSAEVYRLHLESCLRGLEPCCPLQ